MMILFPGDILKKADHDVICFTRINCLILLFHHNVHMPYKRGEVKLTLHSLSIQPCLVRVTFYVYDVVLLLFSTFFFLVLPCPTPPLMGANYFSLLFLSINCCSFLSLGSIGCFSSSCSISASSTISQPSP